MSKPRTETQLDEIAALADPVRRRLYVLVSSHEGDVTREQARRALGITRAAATFHLEKLVDEGLLTADYRRVSGRRGPGAGRPARVYRGPAKEVRIQIPARDYELIARLLLEGLHQKRRSAPKIAHEAAHRFGRTLGIEARRDAGTRPNRTHLIQALTNVLRDRGFQPQWREGGELSLGNCPFDALSRDYRDAVCPTNLSMMHGALDGLGAPGIEAVLDPQPGMCCVTFRPKTRRRDVRA